MGKKLSKGKKKTEEWEERKQGVGRSKTEKARVSSVNFGQGKKRTHSFPRPCKLEFIQGTSKLWDNLVLFMAMSLGTYKPTPSLNMLSSGIG